MSLSLTELRLKHPTFEFSSLSWEVTHDGLLLSFTFKLEPLQPFHHQILIKGVGEEHLKNLPHENLEKYLVLIGMIEGLSYWKAAASPTYRISAAAISPSQLSWLEKLLKKGQGEYFYVNDIDFTRPDFVQLVSSAPDSKIVTRSLSPGEHKLSRYLIPIGGGKDSVVTLLALLDQFGSQATQRLATVMINPNQAQFDTIKGADLPNFLVERRIDPLLLELNAQGYLNGHTPFSAMAAAITTLVAELFGYTHVLTSNERSSNEGSVWYRGEYINHQYSKTLEFENDFREYVTQHLGNAPAYCSYVRPLYELQIAKLFAKLTDSPDWEQLRWAFRSCNRGKKTNSWCGNCSKCLFAFVILSPFIEVRELTEIFGRNVLENPDLVTAALELVGGTPAKPLECVGTLAESKIVFGELIKKYQGKELPVVLEAVKPYLTIPQEMNAQAIDELLWSWDEGNNLPPELGSPLRARLHHLLSPTPSPWKTVPPVLAELDVAHSTLLIAGFGREGLSTYEYLRQVLSPTLEVTVVDDKPLKELSERTRLLIARDPHCTYLETSDTSWQRLDSTVVFKTPGLPLHHHVVTHSNAANWTVMTNTQLFLEVLKTWLGSLNVPYTTIGITGTKGKSTTTSLVHHVLKTAGLTTFLGGNIGVPPLELLQETYQELSQKHAHRKTMYFVLEMSAHQLSDLRVSPNIAIVQDIVPEHLDYYPDFQTYRDAKSHIVRHQKPDDVMIFNPALDIPRQFASLTQAKKLGFGSDRDQAWIENGQIVTPQGGLLSVSQVPLLGAFNLANVLPSVVLSEYLQISPDILRRAITSFRPLAHRLEKVRELNGVLYINDSLSTIPEAAQNAISSLAPKPVILLAGGYDRHLSFSEFANFLSTSSVKKLILFLPTGAHILEELHKVGNARHLIDTAVVVRTMAEAVSAAHGEAKPGDAVLLSPASASFGEFKDYKDRGDQFKLLCQNLQQ